MLKTAFLQIRQSIRRWRALTLLKLPTEVVELIFAQVDKKDLTCLCLASKRAHAIASQILHQTFECEGDQPEVLESIPLFVRTLLQQPHLALAVRTVSIKTSKIKLKNPPDIWRLDKYLAPIAAYEHIDATRVPFAGHWKADLAASNLDAWCALLLSIACNVQHITIAIPSSKSRNLTFSLLHVAACSRDFYALRQVRSLEIGEWNGSGFRRAASPCSEDMVCNLKLPRMTSFACRLDSRDNISKHVASRTMITTLELQCSDFESMARVLGSCPQLVSLSVSISDWEWLRQLPHVSTFNLTDLTVALELVRRSLRHLDMDINVHAMWQQENQHVVGTVSFCAMECLHELTVSQRSLQGFGNNKVPNLDAILPTSLVRLVLTDDHYESAFDSKALSDGSVVEMLTAWIPPRMQRQPSLQSIQVIKKWRWMPQVLESTLWDMADNMGLQFERVRDPGSVRPRDMKISFPT